MENLQLLASSETLLVRIDARVKLAALLICSIGITLTQTWIVLGAFAALVILCAACGRLSLHALLVPLAPVALLAAFAFCFGVWNNPSLIGASEAGIIAMRMLLVVEASFIVCLTTSSAELIKALEKLLGPLRHVGVPVKRICFILALSLRFIPSITHEFSEIRSAQNARGAALYGISMHRRLGNVALACSATFIGMFRHGEVMARALDARCFDLKC